MSPLNVVLEAGSGGGGGPGAISSVFTRTGAIVAASGDYNASQVSNAATQTYVQNLFNSVGVGSALLKANNLSDVQDTGTSRLNLKVPVLNAVNAVASGNVSSLNNVVTIDNVYLNSSGIALLAGQTTPSQNGPWMVQSGINWTRPTDFASASIITRPKSVDVVGGTIYANSRFALSNYPVTVDSTSQTWAQQLPISTISVTQERIWLQDPANGINADYTGVTSAWPAFQAAIARAFAANAPAFIDGRPGTYLMTNANNYPLVLPRYVRLGGGSSLNSLVLNFPTQTGLAFAIGLFNSITAGQTSLTINSVNGVFPAASSGNPGWASVGQSTNQSGMFTYTGISASGGLGGTVTFTGIPATGPYALQSSGFNAVYSNIAMIAKGYPINRYPVVDPSVAITGPGINSMSWTTATRPTDCPGGLFIEGGGEVDPGSVGGFGECIVFASDHETFGGTTFFGSNWAAYSYQSSVGNSDNGNQIWRGGNRITAGWAAVNVSSYNALEGVTWGPNTHIAGCPWGFWKGAVTGVSGAQQLFTGNMSIYDLVCEAPTLGLMGSVDGGAEIQSLDFFGGEIAEWSNNNRPAGFSGPVAVFANAGLFNVNLHGTELFHTIGVAGVPACPAFIADNAYGDWSTIPDVAALVANPPQPYTGGGSPQYSIKLAGGQIASGFNNTTTAGDLVYPRQIAGGAAYHQLYGTFGDTMPAGIAAITETVRAVILATDQYWGRVAANVLQQNTPPTSPTATISATAGTRAAGTWYYKFQHVLSGGGVTGLSTEASVILSGVNSAALGWTNLVTPPHGQTITATRIWVGSTSGGQTGYITQAGTGTTYTDSGASLTTATPPSPNQNVGCEVFGGLVRAWGTTHPGKICSFVASDMAAQPIIGQALNGGPIGQSDNGAQVDMIFTGPNGSDPLGAAAQVAAVSLPLAGGTMLGVLLPVQATTTGAPVYVKGGLYYDTTLSKLRVGGVSGWETVTSA